MAKESDFLEIYKKEILKSKIEILYSISKQKEPIDSGETFMSLMKQFLPEAIMYKDLYSNIMREIGRVKIKNKIAKKKMKKKGKKKTNSKNK